MDGPRQRRAIHTREEFVTSTKDEVGKGGVYRLSWARDAESAARQLHTTDLALLRRKVTRSAGFLLFKRECA